MIGCAPLAPRLSQAREGAPAAGVNSPHFYYQDADDNTVSENSVKKQRGAVQPPGLYPPLLPWPNR